MKKAPKRNLDEQFKHRDNEVVQMEIRRSHRRYKALKAIQGKPIALFCKESLIKPEHWWEPYEILIPEKSKKKAKA